MQKRYLFGAALMALWAGAANAQTLEGAADAAATEAANASGGDIIVFGVGQTRQATTINDQVIAIATPGTSALKVIERLPGVSFQSADPLGNYEWSTRISIRSFNQNQLGFTLDGVPLGDMSYGNYNGLHISRAVISENIESVQVAQGSGALGTASSSNLGGTVQFISRRPGDVFGGAVAGTYGSDNTYRGFVRIDSGELGAAGTRLSLAYAYQTADKWKGDGKQKQQQINFNFVQPIGAGEVSGFVDWSKRRENDYQDLSLNFIGRLGYDWDNISNNWPLIQQIADIANNRGDTGAAVTNAGAGTTYPAPIQTVDDAYANASGLRDDTIGAIKIEYPLTENFRVSAQLYGHQNEGQGLWFTPYVGTPLGAPDASGAPISNPSPISIRTTEYDIERYGFVGSATWELGAHTLEAGFWYEDNDFNQARRFYGLSRNAPGRSSLSMQSNPFFTQWEYDFNTKTTMYHLQDTWSVNDQLTLFAGFKGLKVENEAKTVIGANKDGKIDADDSFLPQLGATYDITPDQQLFLSYAENMRAYPSANTAGPFSTSASGFAAIKNTLEPETSKTVEGGWRFKLGAVQGSLAAYYVKFDNRLLTIPLSVGIVGSDTALQNVGAVESKGVEAAAVWKLSPEWSAFASYTYNDSKYEDDVRDSTGVLVAATAGKSVVDAPKNLLRGELSYDNGTVFAKAGASFTDKRFFTYLNDQSVPSYTIVDISGGYRFGDESGWLKGAELQLNVTNVFDKQYVSTIGSNGFGNSGDNQTLLAGAPRSVFATVRKSF